MSDYRLPLRIGERSKHFMTVPVVDWDGKLVCVVYPKDVKGEDLKIVEASAMERARAIVRALNDTGGTQ